MSSITYKELAKYYDDIYSWKNYEQECKRLHVMIETFKQTQGRNLLDVACGTGNHIAYLKKHYRITGMDINADMLKIAKKKFPKIHFQKGNMIHFDLKKKFDVITCLFSAIGHVKTLANFEKTISCFSEHTNSGAVVLVEPFISPKLFQSGVPHAVIVDRPDLKIARLNVAQRKKDKAILDFHYLIATPKGTKYFRDNVQLGLFDPKKVVSLFKKHGFAAEFREDGLMPRRGIYVAIRL